jgi:hypothetical protein
MTDDASIVTADARLVRLPVDAPWGDAIQGFDALELPIVEIEFHPEVLERFTAPQTGSSISTRAEIVGAASHGFSERRP